MRASGEMAESEPSGPNTCRCICVKEVSQVSPWGVRATGLTDWKEGCVYVHVCTCMCMYHMCACICAHTFACMHMYSMCTCLHARGYVHACACMCTNSAPTLCSKGQAPGQLLYDAL